MDINTILTAGLIAVFIVVGIALVILLLQIVKTLKAATVALNKVEPTLDNVKTMTDDIVPAVGKIDPLMDRVQLTLDSVNLEMMRVDMILEDITEITDAAASATNAVDNLTSAPLKAVNNVATRVKTAVGGKSASQESEQLAEQRVAVAKALEDYKDAEAKEAKKAAQLAEDAAAAAPAVAAAAVESAVEAAPAEQEAAQNDEPKSYVKIEEGEELVIDPQVIAESPFFNDDDK